MTHVEDKRWDLNIVYEEISSFCGFNDERPIPSHVEVIDGILEFLMRKQI